MHFHEVNYSTKKNIYVTMDYAKILFLEGHYLICKPSLVTSLCLGYVIHMCPHSS